MNADLTRHYAQRSHLITTAWMDCLKCGTDCLSYFVPGGYRNIYCPKCGKYEMTERHIVEHQAWLAYYSANQTAIEAWWVAQDDKDYTDSMFTRKMNEPGY